MKLTTLKKVIAAIRRALPWKFASKRFLIYTASFGGGANQWLLTSLFISIDHNLKGPPLFDAFVITDDDGARALRDLLPHIGFAVKTIVVPTPKQHLASTWVRYKIHDLADTTAYSHIFYLDNDVWVHSDLNAFFCQMSKQTSVQRPLLAFKDSNSSPRCVGDSFGLSFYGGLLFQRKGKLQQYITTPGFSTGILFFANTSKVSALFRDAPLTFQEFRRSEGVLPRFYKCDQPYINYLAISRGLVNLAPLDALIWNNPSTNDANKAVFFHFCGRIGNPDKPDKVSTFVNGLTSQPAHWKMLQSKLRILTHTEAEQSPRTLHTGKPKDRPRARPQLGQTSVSENASDRNKYLPLINRKIPGQMTDDELAHLMLLASTVPPGGIIVEVGSLYGLSSWHISKAASPGVTIFCLDPWQRTPWIVRLVEKPQNAPAFGRNAFECYTEDCDNLVKVQGFSPDTASGWQLPIDMYFEDAVHSNPQLSRNLTFWKSKLKPRAIICGHDYSTEWPDVVSEVDALAQTYRSSLELVDTLWSIRTQ